MIYKTQKTRHPELVSGSLQFRSPDRSRNYFHSEGLSCKLRLCRSNTISQFGMTVLAFTLAEVLITLGIIGLVASMTIPTVMQNVQEREFKTGYKKAYSELFQVFSQSITDGTFPPRAAKFDAASTTAEWNLFKSSFKVVKECIPASIDSCWAPGDTISGGKPSSTAQSYSFIDSSGRSWANFNTNENLYMVDTNGFKNPNRFGKDRWIFTFQNSDNTRSSSGIPAKIGAYSGIDATAPDDVTASTAWCNYPPCNYKSWLFDN